LREEAILATLGIIGGVVYGATTLALLGRRWLARLNGGGRTASPSEIP
jgi:hypothetical protein